MHPQWTALQTLRSIKLRHGYHHRAVSRAGYRVQSSADNLRPIVSIATTMRSDNKGALRPCRTPSASVAAKVDVAYTGMESDIERRLRNQGQAGCGPRSLASTRTKIDKELTELKNPATFRSPNRPRSRVKMASTTLVRRAVGNKEIVGGFNRDSAGLVPHSPRSDHHYRYSTNADRVLARKPRAS